MEAPGKLRALFYLSSRKPVPQRYRAWLATELREQSPATFAVKSALLNILMVLVMGLLVLRQGYPGFAAAFVLLALAMLAFVALVPDVGRRRMVNIAERNGLARGERQERPEGTLSARLEARRAAGQHLEGSRRDTRTGPYS